MRSHVAGGRKIKVQFYLQPMQWGQIQWSYNECGLKVLVDICNILAIL